jgi:hypothetical protein
MNTSNNTHLNSYKKKLIIMSYCKPCNSRAAAAHSFQKPWTAKHPAFALSVCENPNAVNDNPPETVPSAIMQCVLYISIYLHDGASRSFFFFFFFFFLT